MIMVGELLLIEMKCSDPYNLLYLKRVLYLMLLD